MESFDDFLALVREQQGPPPFGLKTWEDVVMVCLQYKAEIMAALEEERSSLLISTGEASKENFEGWTEAKRRAMNQAAALAYRRAKARGSATNDERQQMLCYTGFGGFRNVGVLPSAFPPEYIEASREAEAAWRVARQPSDRALDIIGRVKDQYFTPLPAARVAWDLLIRAHGGVPATVLEPSAGIGRFAMTAPASCDMQLVEFDELMADMLRLIFPSQRVFSGPFENWVRDAKPVFDAAIGNPPWPRRSEPLRVLDMPDQALNVDYFMLRGASVLRPGGTLCFLVPASFLLGGSHREARGRLLRSCAFRGAALLPSGLYPLVRETTSTLILVTRRAAGTKTFDARERAVIEGRFLELPEAEQAPLGGVWAKSSRGSDGAPYLEGPVEVHKAANVVISAFALEGVKAPRKKKEPEETVLAKVSITVKPEQAIEAQKEADAVVVDTLAQKCRAWVRLINTDPDGAETQRPELLRDVTAYLAEYGVPTKPEILALVEGTVPSRVLTTPLQTAQTENVVGHTTLEAAVAWHCDRKGFATAGDVSQFGDEYQVTKKAAAQGLYIVLAPDGTKFYTRPYYMFGSAVSRLQEIERTSVDDLEIRDRLETQKAEILKVWQRKLLADIDYNPRSSFIPIQVVEEWVNDTARGEDPIRYKRIAVVPEWERLKAEVEKLKETDPTAQMPKEINEAEIADQTSLVELQSEFFQVTLKEDCLFRHTTGDDFVKTRDLLKWLIPYMNRSKKVEKDDGSTGRATSSDAETQLKIDREWENKFRSWLSSSKWVSAIEDEYNRISSSMTVELPTTPVELPGKNPELELRPHQNQGVRRSCMGGRARSALLAYDVGAGKTLTGSAIARKWKADGLATRVLIAVPTSVLAKWVSDVKWLFPTARVGVIGLSYGKDGKPKSATDSVAVRLQKWLAFGAGAYDVCIVSHPLFWRDLEADPQMAANVVSELAWARRKAGEGVLEARRLHRFTETLQADLVKAQKVLDEQVRKEEMYKANGWSFDSEKKDAALSKVAKINAKIEETKAAIEALPKATDSESTAVSEWVRAAMASKPYRPQVKVGTVISGDSDIDLEVEDEEIEDEDEDEGPSASVEVKKVPIPGLVSWEELGVDGLIIDEFHNFRSTFFPAARAGGKIEYCGRAEDKDMFATRSSWDMYIKCASVTAKHGGSGGVIGLTATPANNSLLEVYNLVQMVAPALWAEHGIAHKEEFIDRYFDIEATDIVKPKGEIVTGPGLVGVKKENRLELLNTLNIIMDRKTTKQLMLAGWIRGTPDVQSERVFTERDPVQFVLIKNLTALLLSFTEKDDEAKLKKAMEGTDEVEILTAQEKEEAKGWWTLDANWRPVRAGKAPEWKEVFGESISKERKNVSIFRLIWMGLVDKVAMDPRLLSGILPKLAQEQAQEQKRFEALKEWTRKKIAGEKVSKSPPTVAKESRFTTVTINYKLMELLDIEGKLPYYTGANRYCRKVQALAEFIRDNRMRPQGECAHVVFCDWKELFPQITEALTTIAGIPKNKIANITGGKGGTPIGKRLAVSRALNGTDMFGQPVPPTLSVVIGTSKAMAEGIDLQVRSCGVHHLTMPWVPSTVHQRNGRAVRQGNLMGLVDLRYHLTEKTYDALRFDKVTKKAGWLDTIFDDTQDTSNPAKGSTIDPEEIILSMVIENEKILEDRLTKLRAKRAASKRAKQLKEVEEAWLKINSYFHNARIQPDATTRATLFAQNQVRLEKLQVTWPIPEAARQAVLHETTYYDPATEDVILPGDFVIGDRGAVMRVLRHEVKGSSWLHHVRDIRQIYASVLLRLEPRDIEGKKPEGQSIEEDVAYLLRRAEDYGDRSNIFNYLGRISTDLLPYKDQFWQKFCASPVTLHKLDWLLYMPSVAPDAMILPTLYISGESLYDLTTFTKEAGKQPHVFMPNTEPEAFELFCRSVASGRLYLGVTPPSVAASRRPVVPWSTTPFRGTSPTADELAMRKACQQVFARALPSDVWQLRQKLIWGK